MTLKYKVGQQVFMCVNPLHMEVIEANPIIEGVIERIRKTVLITAEGETEAIEYCFAALCFEKWKREDEIFNTYNQAACHAKIMLSDLINKRLEVNSKIEQSLSEVTRSQ
jgi:hypothetical protein